MKLGVNILNYGQGTSPDSLRGWARLAEHTGFSIAMISDHIALTPDVRAAYPAPFYDPFTTLAWLAAQTERIELGTTVAVLPYRNPLLTARVAANIDQFSGGRFVLGVGVGESQREYAALGIPFQRRGAIADEYLAAITQVWTADVASMDGRFVSFHDVHTGPRPVRRPHPPIWVGGSSPAGIRRAARFADAWHPINPRLSWLREQGLPRLRAAAEAAGRPVPALCPRINLRIEATTLNDQERRIGVGSMAQVLRDLHELAELGSERVVLDTYLGWPESRQPLAEDWRMLEAVFSRAQVL
ncbi:MAG TPA: TIGR03619 family F420-dependent LLM class oxidoreductase [Actinomycetes bacterium]|nr:TIGR03619 family F420-dependent LLM class oxidoreductase [Actinomycetes bacterium]